nr:EF hand domain containing protein [Haemonchus contortus]
MAEDIEEILAEIDGEQIEEYQKFFDDFDRGKQGYIMATQIGQIMRAMEQEFDEKTLRKLIRKFDADGSGKLEFDEFCALVYTVANTVDKDTLQKELRDAFRLFDKEGNGYISRPTLKALKDRIRRILGVDGRRVRLNTRVNIHWIVVSPPSNRCHAPTAETPSCFPSITRFLSIFSFEFQKCK